jgi:hypothetical protein
MNETFTPDLSEARRLLDAGLHLVKLKQHSKQPQGDDWNSQHNRARYIDDQATGYGLPLASNHACSVDPDNWPLAVCGMRSLGLDIEAIMAAGVRTTSTRPGSGGRSAFAEEPDLSWLRFSSRDAQVGTVIEFRAASANLQDVVPGLVYRDKSGAVRTQAYANGKRLDDLPGLPDDLMVWWQRCSTDIEFLRQQQEKFMAAIGARANLAISTGRGGSKLAFNARGYRGRYNAAKSVESILEQHDYTWHPREQRWSPPTATGAPGVRPIPGCDGLWQSDHASDPLTGTFDAWIAHVVLDHFGDMEAAKRAMDKEEFTPTVDLTALIDPETGEIRVAAATPSGKPAGDDVLPHISAVEVWSEGALSSVPEHLLDLPHPLLRQTAQLMDAAAEDTDRAMTVLGVIHLASATVARRVISNKRNCAALYLCGVARTGRGKNAAKNFVAKALDRAFNQGVCSEFSSGSGIFSLMTSWPAAAMHLDEFGDKLGHGLRDRVGSPVAKGFSYLKEVFSQADDRISPAAFSLVSLTAKQRKDFLESNKPIQMPHLNILAVTTPGQLGDAVTDASVEGGLINRFLFVEACGQILENKQFDATPPEWLISHMRSARSLGEGGNLALESLEPGLPDLAPVLREYAFCGTSMAVLDAYKAEIRCLVTNDEFLADMSQRWREIAMRMALALHAFSEPGVQTIDPAITSWAIDYTRHYGRSFARKLLSMAQPTETYGRRRKAYLEAFRGRPEGTTSHVMGRMAPWRNDSPILRGQIIKDMLASGDIAQVWVDKPARGPAPKVIVSLA